QQRAEEHRRAQESTQQRAAEERNRTEWHQQLDAEHAMNESPLMLTATAFAETPKTIVQLVGNNAICYQGIQRTFRNAIVVFVRTRLPRLHPTDHLQRMKKLFGDDWEKAAQNANQSRDMFGTTTAIRDDYDLLGTNHFFGLIEKFYDKLFT